MRQRTAAVVVVAAVAAAAAVAVVVAVEDQVPAVVAVRWVLAAEVAQWVPVAVEGQAVQGELLPAGAVQAEDQADHLRSRQWLHCRSDQSCFLRARPCMTFP